jgi:CHAD domain-containing protein
MVNFLVGLDTSTLQTQLNELQSRLETWPLDEVSRATAVAGIRRSYKYGRRAWKKVLANPSTAKVHDWRKQVKYLWYHVRLLSDWNRSALKPLAKQLDELGELLGVEHDLAVLGETLEEQPELCGDSLQAELITGLAIARRRNLLDQALKPARDLYSARPREFAARLGLE